MNITKGIYRGIEIEISIAVDGSIPCHQLDIVYAHCSSEINRKFSNDKLVAKAFNIPSVCKESNMDHFPNLFWSNMEGRLVIQSSAITKDGDITLFDYLNHIFRAIDKVIDG